MLSGDFPGALAAYRRARDQEPRLWVDREITAQIVWCYRALGQPTFAAAEFLLLVRADPATPYFDCIPLGWFSSFRSQTIERAAQGMASRRDDAGGGFARGELFAAHRNMPARHSRSFRHLPSRATRTWRPWPGHRPGVRR